MASTALPTTEVSLAAVSHVSATPARHERLSGPLYNSDGDIVRCALTLRGACPGRGTTHDLAIPIGKVWRTRLGGPDK